MQSELKENTDGINRVRERAGLSPISSYSLQALQNERDSLRSRLKAARARVDELIERLPENREAR